jgi:hypothetical protein
MTTEENKRFLRHAMGTFGRMQQPGDIPGPRSGG